MFFAQSHEENQRIDKRGHHCFGSKYREYGAPSIRMPNKRPSPWAPQGFSYRWFRRILCSSPPSSGCNIRPQDSWRRAQRLFRNLSRRLIQTFPSSIGLVLMKDFRLVQWFHLTHHPLKVLKDWTGWPFPAEQSQGCFWPIGQLFHKEVALQLAQFHSAPEGLPPLVL